MNSKKGISPLIATVLIIGFTIVLSVFILTWGSDLIKNLTKEQELTINKEIAKVDYDIKLKEYSNDHIILSLENNAETKIDSFDVFLERNGERVKILENLVDIDKYQYKTNTYGQPTILFLPFDENANDYSGENNIILKNTAVHCDNCGNLNNGAYKFLSNYIKINDSNLLDFNESNDFTIEFWMYLNDISNFRQNVISKEGNYLVRIFKTNEPGGYGNKTQIVFINSTNKQNSIISLIKIEPKKWYHVIAIKNGLSHENMKLYINGVKENQLVSRGGAVNNFTKDLFLGSSAGTGEFLNGIIDNIKIYNKALSDEEVIFAYKNPIMFKEGDVLIFIPKIKIEGKEYTLQEVYWKKLKLD